MSMFTLAISCMTTSNLPWFSEGKASAYNAGDPGLIPGLGRSPGEVNGNPLQYSCLKNPMDWEAWWATVKGVAKNRTWLSDFTSLLHGLNIPGSYAILLFTVLDLSSITSHIHNLVLFCFGSVPLFFMQLFLHWSPVAYWAPTDQWSSSFSVPSFCLFKLFMGFSR